MTIDLLGTVITGFEEVAQREAIAQGWKASPKRGSVYITAEKKDIGNCLKLRSIDNLYMILADENIPDLKILEPVDAYDRIRNLIKYINWSHAMECWQIAFGKNIFNGPEGLKEKMKTFLSCQQNAVVEDDAPTFRVTCNRAGEKNQHKFSSMDAARIAGAYINNMFGWRPRMKNFDIEVVLNVRYESVSILIALNSTSLYCRNMIAFGPTTMRSTMCFCMISLAKPKKYQIIVDPMCGGGSIPIEGALAFPDTFFFGGDYHEKAIERCLENLKDKDCSIGIVRWDAANLPFANKSVDGIVTDLPFGKKIGSRTDNRILYPMLLKEWHRVVRSGGRVVIMTHDRRSLENGLHSLDGKFRMISRHICNQGGLTTLCLVLQTL